MDRVLLEINGDSWNGKHLKLLKIKVGFVGGRENRGNTRFNTLTLILRTKLSLRHKAIFKAF